MKKIYGKIVLIFLIAISSAIAFADPIDTDTTNVQTKQYFSDLSIDGLAYIKKYSSIPQNRTRTDPEKYGHILRKFWGWMEGTLNKEILPPHSIMTNNIILIPADGKINEDIAYCAYSISNTSFLVVQNVKKVILFTDCRSYLPEDNSTPVKDYILLNTTNWLSTNLINQLQIINIKQLGSYYIAKNTPERMPLESWIQYVNLVEIVTSGKQICISIEKRGNIFGYAPASEPLPNRWFDGPRSQRGQEKKNTSHSITNGITNSIVK